MDAYFFGLVSSPNVGMAQIAHDYICTTPFFLCLEMFSRADREVFDHLANLASLDESWELAGHVFPWPVVGAWETFKGYSIRKEAMLDKSLENGIDRGIG